MTSQRWVQTIGQFAILAVALLLLMVSCASSYLATPPDTPEISETDTTPTDVWSGLLQKTP